MALACAALLAAGAIAGCGTSSGANANSALYAATVNGHNLALSDYQRVVAVYKASAAAQGQASDWQSTAGRKLLSGIETDAVNFLVDLELGREQLKTPLTTKDIQPQINQLDSVKKQYGGASSDAASKALASALTPETIKLFAEQQTVQQKLASQVSVPSAHVLAIATKTQADAETYLKQVQQGGNFAKIAKAHSTDSTSAAKGGDLGTIYIGDLGSAFDKQVFVPGAKPAKVFVSAVGSQYGVFEVSDTKTVPLKSISSQQEQTNSLTSWLQEVVHSTAHVKVYVSTK